jgi:hypothetical protein
MIRPHGKGMRICNKDEGHIFKRNIHKLNECVAPTNIIISNKFMELKNMGKFVYKTKFKS